jgi:hypothetical protein
MDEREVVSLLVRGNRTLSVCAFTTLAEKTIVSLKQRIFNLAAVSGGIDATDLSPKHSPLLCDHQHRIFRKHLPKSSSIQTPQHH